MSAIVSVYAVFGSEEEANRICRKMIEDGLAACVNILGECTSIYRWHDKVEQADEVAAIFKCGAERAQALTDAIVALHSYDVPAVVTWPIEASPQPYRDWVTENGLR